MDEPDPNPDTVPLYEEALSPPTYLEAEGKDETSPATPAGPTVADPAPPEILAPAVLVLAGQTIHAESAPNEALYKVNRGLASLGPSTQRVELERIEQRLSPTGRLKARPRHIYNLIHVGTFLVPSSLKWAVFIKAPEYCMKPVSSKSAPFGCLGLKPSHSPRTEKYTVMPLRARPHEVAVYDKDRPAAVFKARVRNNICTWTDANGQEVARQYETNIGGPTIAPRLVITAPMRRDHRDALVALWCLYVWRKAVSRHVPVPVPRPKHPTMTTFAFR